MKTLAEYVNVDVLRNIKESGVTVSTVKGMLKTKIIIVIAISLVLMTLETLAITQLEINFKIRIEVKLNNRLTFL